jgi:hypothetical protein
MKKINLFLNSEPICFVNEDFGNLFDLMKSFTALTKFMP